MGGQGGPQIPEAVLPATGRGGQDPQVVAGRAQVDLAGGQVVAGPGGEQRRQPAGGGAVAELGAGADQGDQAGDARPPATQRGHGPVEQRAGVGVVSLAGVGQRQQRRPGAGRPGLLGGQAVQHGLDLAGATLEPAQEHQLGAVGHGRGGADRGPAQLVGVGGQQLAVLEVAPQHGHGRAQPQRQPEVAGEAALLGGPGLPLGQPVDAVQVAGGQQGTRPGLARLPGQVVVAQLGGQAVQLVRGGQGGRRPLRPQDAVAGGLLVGQDRDQGPPVAEPAGHRHRLGEPGRVGLRAPEA